MLKSNDKADAGLKKARLNRAIKSSKAIQELAGNPLLLTMMAILSRHRKLPRDYIIYLSLLIKLALPLF